MPKICFWRRCKEVCAPVLTFVLAAVWVFTLIRDAGAGEPTFERGIELIRNELRIAATGVRAMALAAHPDDEDGATLSFLRKAGCETHICFCTRGEGGQNEAGAEVGAQLAALRTREIDEACAILGAKPWFLNLPDFGFSKSVEETMKIWNHDLALERIVRVIRRVRPHIVISNHDPDGTDHGHHRSAAKLLVEAFDAAADPAKFPNQIKDEGLKPWSIMRIYRRHFAPPSATITVDVSKRDGVGGLSASEIGAYALSRHFSQGMLRTLKAGERELRYFSILKSRATAAKADTLLDGIVEEGATDQFKAMTALAAAISTKDIDDGTLAQRIAQIAGAPGISGEARMHLNRALAEALGLKVEVHSDDEFITAGEKAKVSVRAANTGTAAVKLAKVSFKAESQKWTLADAAPGKELKSGAAEGVELEIGAAEGAPLSYPVQEHLFLREESRMPVTAVAEFSVSLGTAESVTLSVEAPVPLGLAAKYSFALEPDPVLKFNAAGNDELAEFKLLVTRNAKGAEPLHLAGRVGPRLAPGVSNQGEKVITLGFKGDTAVWSLKQLASDEDLNRGDVTIVTQVWDAAEFYTTPVQTVRRASLDMPGNMRVALVKGTDDQTYNALKRMQDGGMAQGTFSVEALTDLELLTTKLSRYQAIVLDIRSTQQRPVLRKMTERLKTFMEEGGTVVCLYQKDFDWNDHDKGAARGVGFFRGTGGGGQIAPFPIELSFDRITDEAAPVTLLTPEHPLLRKPCRIWPKDFDGWVQERGAYFPKKWAPDYTAVLSSNDAGEKALEGGLLVADVGRGAFIYTSYFWHHQLRTGTPGAYRMMANMMCYSRMKREGNEK